MPILIEVLSLLLLCTPVTMTTLNQRHNSAPTLHGGQGESHAHRPASGRSSVANYSSTSAGSDNSDNEVGLGQVFKPLAAATRIALKQREKYPHHSRKKAAKEVKERSKPECILKATRQQLALIDDIEQEEFRDRGLDEVVLTKKTFPSFGLPEHEYQRIRKDLSRDYPSYNKASLFEFLNDYTDVVNTQAVSKDQALRLLQSFLEGDPLRSVRAFKHKMPLSRILDNLRHYYCEQESRQMIQDRIAEWSFPTRNIAQNLYYLYTDLVRVYDHKSLQSIQDILEEKVKSQLRQRERRDLEQIERKYAIRHLGQDMPTDHFIMTVANMMKKYYQPDEASVCYTSTESETDRCEQEGKTETTDTKMSIDMQQLKIEIRRELGKDLAKYMKQIRKEQQQQPMQNFAYQHCGQGTFQSHPLDPARPDAEPQMY